MPYKDPERGRANHFDHLAPVLRRVRRTSFCHLNTSCEQAESVHRNGATPGISPGRRVERMGLPSWQRNRTLFILISCRSAAKMGLSGIKREGY